MGTWEAVRAPVMRSGRPARPGPRWAAAACAAAVALAVAGCSSLNGLHGRMISRDDSAVTQQAVTDGWIIAVPEGDAWQLWSPASPPQSVAALATTQVAVSAENVKAMGGTVAPLDGSGNFSLAVDPGRHVLCWLTAAADGSTRTNGCANEELPSAGQMIASTTGGAFSVTLEVLG
jgi:hypothetical protein